MSDESTCAHCAKPAEGDYTIHRDGFGEGLEVPLCNACGGFDEPSLEQIWARIARSRERSAER